MSDQELHVIFGTGPLGMSVMRELVVRGKKVRMVNRSGKATVPAGVDVVATDVYAIDRAAQAAGGAAVVYLCANAPYTNWPALLPPLFANITEAAARAKARLIVGDNLYMYGEVDGMISETLPNAAITKKGRVRARVSDALLQAHKSGRVQVAIGRGSDFFGPGVLDSVMGERVFPLVLAGKKVAAIGNPDVLHTYTFIEDFGKALVNLGEREEALGQFWHVPNAGAVTTRHFLTMAFEEAGQKPLIGSMGKMMMRIGGLFIPPAREMVEMMYEFEKPFVVDHGKYAKVFGNHATPLKESIRRTVDWYGSNYKSSDRTIPRSVSQKKTS